MQRVGICFFFVRLFFHVTDKLESKVPITFVLAVSVFFYVVQTILAVNVNTLKRLTYSGVRFCSLVCVTINISSCCGLNSVCFSKICLFLGATNKFGCQCDHANVANVQHTGLCHFFYVLSQRGYSNICFEGHRSIFLYVTNQRFMGIVNKLTRLMLLKSLICSMLQRSSNKSYCKSNLCISNSSLAKCTFIIWCGL